MVDGRGFWSVGLFLLGLWGLSSLGLRGCFSFFLYFWVTLWVFLFVFSVGHEWSMLRLGGSGVLSQGAGFGVFGVCSPFP